MKIGDIGLDVIEVQDWLISIGYLDSKEKFYSIKTSNAVKKLESDLNLIPTGNYSEQLRYIYELKSMQIDTYDNVSTTSNVVDTTNNATNQASFDDSYLQNRQSVPCYIVNLITNNSKDEGVIFIPHIPEEFSYSKGNNYDEQQTRGRSEPFLGYSGSTSLTTSVSFTVSADYSPNRDIDSVLNKLEALSYPRYGNTIIPPKAFFRCGSFSTEGVITEVSITRRLPVINGKYSIAEVSISFTETNPESISAVKVTQKGFRG